jgi:hypothetical protein
MNMQDFLKVSSRSLRACILKPSSMLQGGHFSINLEIVALKGFNLPLVSCGRVCIQTNAQISIHWDSLLNQSFVKATEPNYSVIQQCVDLKRSFFRHDFGTFLAVSARMELIQGKEEIQALRCNSWAKTASAVAPGTYPIAAYSPLILCFPYPEKTRVRQRSHLHGMCSSMRRGKGSGRGRLSFSE